MTPCKPLILLKKSGASSFQHVSRQTTKSRHFGEEIDGRRGPKRPKFLHLEVAEKCRETTHATEQLHPHAHSDQQRQGEGAALRAERWRGLSSRSARPPRRPGATCTASPAAAGTSRSGGTQRSGWLTLGRGQRPQGLGGTRCPSGACSMPRLGQSLMERALAARLCSKKLSGNLTN